MQRRNPNATAALLQKANSQLRGEKIEKPEDELNEYINSLTQKTAQQKKAVNFEDLGDSISISSDIEDIKYQSKPAVTTSAGSKFLKKKTPTADEDEKDKPAAASKFIKKPQASSTSPAPAPSTQTKYGQKPVAQMAGPRTSSQGNRSVTSALDKASAITGKIKERVSTRKAFTIDSDSDESLAAAMKMARSSGEQISESLTTESVKVGRDGGKFLKKATPSPAHKQTSSPAPSTGPPLTSTRGQSPARNSQQEPKAKKASPFQLKSSLKYSTDVVLTSEEESLAEFVGGLPSSSGDSFEKPQTRHGRRTSPPARSPKHARSPSPTPPARSGRETPKGGKHSISPQSKPPVIRRTPSPSPRTNGSRSPGLRRRSPSPKLMRSYSDDSNVADSIKSEIAEDFDIGVNIIMDLEDLAPAIVDELPTLQNSAPSLEPSPTKSKERKSRTKEREEKKSKISDKDRSDLSAKKVSTSPFKAAKSGPSSSKTEKSPFKSSQKESPFKAKSDRNKSPFKAEESSLPVKAANKENVSPFKSASDRDSPFKAKTESSPFKANDGGSSIFSAKKDFSSPFRSSSAKNKDDSDRDSSPFKPGKRSETKVKSGKSSKKSNKKSSKTRSKPSDVFSSFGIQTIEDLLGPSVKESEYESVVSEVDEVRTDVSDEIRTEKPSIYSYSQKFDDTEIETEVEASKPAATYTDEFESISEKIGVPSDHGRSTSLSEVKTRYSGDETGQDDTEYSESDTETMTQSRTRSLTPDSEEESRTRSDTYSYTSYTEDFTKSLVPSRSDRTPIPPRGMTSTEAQTAFDGIHYAWDPYASGLAFQGIPRGLEFVDPTPIATHVVSADALEAMTGYSPAMLALQDMLKAQYELTKEFLDSQRRLYQDFARNIEPTFKYTTLQDAKKYIKKNKKKRLTFKEALQLVDLEMAKQKR